MNNDDNHHEAGADRGRGRARLRLVSTVQASQSQRAVAPTTGLLPGAYDIRFTSPRLPGALKNGPPLGTDDIRRHDVRHKEGMKMRTIERMLQTVGRFVVAFGAGVALVCAFVIVTTDVGPGAPKLTQPAEVTHLDPVVVTISSDRFDAIRAEAQPPSALVRKPDHGEIDG